MFEYFFLLHLKKKNDVLYMWLHDSTLASGYISYPWGLQ